MNDKQQPQNTSRFDLMWVMNLFGTAVGAGILFLPIRAGQSGLWPILVMAAIVGPMTYLSHRGLGRMVLSAPRPDRDITGVVTEFFGPLGGPVLTTMYFCAIYPIMLVYAVSITNTVDNFLVHQMHCEPLPRSLLAFLCVSAYMGVILLGIKLVIIINERLTYPLCLVLLGLALYLIPHWDFSQFSVVPAPGEFLTTVWQCLPVLVFAFSHTPAISTCAVSMIRRYGADGEQHANRVFLTASSLLTVFTMFFVISCALALTTDDLKAADAQNITVLSYLANKLEAPFIGIVGPVVALLAISTSFFGHYLGAREGLNGIIAAVTHGPVRGSRRRRNGITLFFFVTLWAVATINPRVLSIIESLSGPILAVILFLLPMYAVAMIPDMARYRGQWTNVFVTVMGTVTIASLLLTFL